ncbi:Guanylate cyclase receptor-type gcy-1 [Mizuhopecten yessoensis]|uniref:Guanylate cyclase receptor-type gcy-1 n=1 Tax=Mizuhopecten yessoensis TaxID=6573 RepID=A0A210Q8U3_MIZYE|nr:Guanylate cyclase receptor-type gcy-1 [Mizuhopecten yessoensis]
MAQSSARTNPKEGSGMLSRFSGLSETEKENEFVTVSTGCCSQTDNVSFSKKGQRCQMIKILFPTLIPIFVLTCITLVGVIESISDYATQNAIRQGVYTGLDIGEVVHQTQRERGVSVMYLSSNGDPLVRDVLLEIHQITDNAIAELKAWPTSTNLPAYFKSKLTYHERIQQYRDLVVNKSITSNRIIQLYSDLNAVIIEWIAQIANLAVSGQLWKSMVSYHLLLLAKDETGLERALGSSIYAIGTYSSSDLASYIEKKSTASMYTDLCMTYSTIVSSMLNDNYMYTQLHVDITEMRREIVENNMTVLSSLGWFANMTSYINILKDIQDTLGSSILSALEMELKENNTAYNLSIGLMVGAVFLYPIILAVVFKLTYQIQQVAMSLKAQTSLLSKERKRSETLLCEMLPASVARKLMVNEKVEPQMYKCATVFFSDVVGFTTICSGCTPFEGVDFLNLLYNTFDSQLEEHDVYKVETIGDAYMVVSGIPELNGDRHVKEISQMALAILDTASKLDVPHLSRNNIGLKGKGKMTTFWLERHDNAMTPTMPLDSTMTTVVIE